MPLGRLHERLDMSARRFAAVLGGLALTASLGLASASPASAHATIQLYGGKATAGGYGALWMRIPHGCEGSPTLRVVITVPASFGSAKPQMIGGWRSKVLARPDGSRLVVWNATGAPLRDDEFQDFGISVKWPSAEGVVLLPTVQTCEEGKVAWVDPDPAADHPAPRVTIAAASSPGH